MRCKSLLLAACFGIVLMRAEAGLGDAKPSREIDLPQRGLCAHRGASDTHPENTLAAFREAVRLGAHMIELDVCLSKDHEPVVMHDLAVDRTTNGKGKVSDLTLAELKRLDAGGWKSPEFKGEPIPTLDEALRIMPVNIWLNVHLKGGKEVGEKAAQVIVRQDRLHQAFLACDAATAEAAHAVDVRVIICNMERRGASAEYVKDTIARQAQFIQLAGIITADLPRHTQELKTHGIRINFFSADSPEELRALFGAGVEFPLVNRVGTLMAVARELGIQPVTPKFNQAAGAGP
jgi:glycerophosphoryl diester phosphodiesterase